MKQIYLILLLFTGNRLLKTIRKPTLASTLILSLFVEKQIFPFHEERFMDVWKRSFYIC